MALNHPPIINGVVVPYGDTVEDLKRRLIEPGPMAWAAFAALSRTPSMDALRSLGDYAHSADWRYRRLAVEAISNHVLASEAADILLSALTDSNTYVMIEGCRAVADHRLLQSHMTLISLLSHPEPTVREAAVVALANLWRTQDFERVKRVHMSDPSSEVRKKAAWTLMLNSSISTWQDLYALWHGSPMGRYRLWAVKLARQFGGDEASTLLAGFQDDLDGHVRKAAFS